LIIIHDSETGNTDLCIGKNIYVYYCPAWCAHILLSQRVYLVKMLPVHLAGSTDFSMNYMPCIKGFCNALNNYRYSGAILNNSRNLYLVVPFLHLLFGWYNILYM
jgi:hypothetical protein